MKAGLGVYLDCLRARPDLTDALQGQADMALRQACQDEDVKWVSLLRWLGASPRSKGQSTDDLDDDVAEDPDYQQSALQIACSSRKPEILRQLKPDPAPDDLQELMAAAGGWITTPETVAYLVSLGADVNDRADGGSTVLDAALRYFGWKEAVWEGPYGAYRRVGRSARQTPVLPRGSPVAHGPRRPLGARGARDHGGAPRPLPDGAGSRHGCRRPAAGPPGLHCPGASGLDGGAEDASVARISPKDRGGPSPRRHVTGPDVANRAAAPRRPVRHSHRYDRQRLYDEVWKQPSEAVAKRYGVTGVAIAKACRLMDVPKPPRGYWAKVAAGGKLPKRPPLPK